MDFGSGHGRLGTQVRAERDRVDRPDRLQFGILFRGQIRMALQP
jgi:hypothetical protein